VLFERSTFIRAPDIDRFPDIKTNIHHRFMLAQNHAKPWAYMTSYGRIDGIHCSENPRLLNDILRKEWQFDGLVMSDWFGTYSVDQAIQAGLDLEMPGPPRWRTPLLVNHTLGAQKIAVEDINARVYALLSFVQKLAAKNPEVVFGDGVERSKDSPESRRFCRKLTAETMVLLKNKTNLLPLRPDKVKKLAIIGPHAKASVISGGGSAALKPTYIITPWDGITRGAPEDISISYTIGTYADRYLPTLESLIKTDEGKPGWTCTFYAFTDEGSTKDIASYDLTETKVKVNDFIPKGLGEEWGIRLRGHITVERDMPFEFGLAVAGRAKLYVDGDLAIDNWTKQRPGDFFYGQGTAEEKAVVNLKGGQAAEIMIDYLCTSPPPGPDDDLAKLLSQPALMRGLRLGGAEKIDEDKAIKDAAELAYNADVAVVICGLTSEWESEGFDRPTLDLPRRQNELITKVCRANPKTIVVIQSGSAVSMPWVADADGIMQAWLSGNEAGNAIADVLFGKVNPSGRLPLTLPAKIEDTPAFLSFGSEDGKVVYREDLFVGYKHYQARKIRPLFPFGHGLSYTTFSLSDIKVQDLSRSGNALSYEVSVTVTNTGDRIGSEVIMLFVNLPENGTTTPSLQLRGFVKANDVPPRKRRTVSIKLDKYAFSYWDSPRNTWNVVRGTYGLHIGTSSDNLFFQEEVVLKSGFNWNGL